MSQCVQSRGVDFRAPTVLITNNYTITNLVKREIRQQLAAVVTLENHNIIIIISYILDNVNSIDYK